MSAKNGKFKNRGNSSRKVQRQLRAKARQEAFDKLPDTEKREQMDANRAAYKS